MTSRQNDPITVATHGLAVPAAVAVLGTTGCTIDRAGNVHWMRSSDEQAYDGRQKG